MAALTAAKSKGKAGGTIKSPMAGTVRDNLFATSIGYTFKKALFENDLGVAVGYSYRNEDSIATHTVGVLLTYTFCLAVRTKCDDDK